MKISIVTIGDEILIGQIVDTNSAWMAHKLTQSGFDVHDIISIGDEANQIKDTIKSAFESSDVILMTGGIGPTKDDITKKTLCEYFGTQLIFDESVLSNIHNVISSTFSLNELTRTQAYVPENATVIQNKVGTAPITWFDTECNKVLVSMPGVPYEMKYSMDNEIIPRLQKKFSLESYLSQVVIVGGFSESGLALHLTDFENDLPEGFGLAYLPSPGLVKLRLFVKGDHRKDEFLNQVSNLESLLGKSIIAMEDIPVEKILSQRLIEQNLTIATAESCTGGRIAHLITSIQGASQYFKGSIVAYSNEIKCNVLGVSESTIRDNGAVSEQTVLEMVRGTKQLFKTDCLISVSGIAGPDGGSDEKPVGTIWIATNYKNETVARKYQMGKYREANIIRASNIAMLQLLEMII